MDETQEQPMSGTMLLAEIVGKVGLHSLTIGYLLQAHLDENDPRGHDEILQKVVAANDQLILDLDSLFPGQLGEAVDEARSRLESR